MLRMLSLNIDKKATKLDGCLTFMKLKKSNIWMALINMSPICADPGKESTVRIDMPTSATWDVVMSVSSIAWSFLKLMLLIVIGKVVMDLLGVSRDLNIGLEELGFFLKMLKVPFLIVPSVEMLNDIFFCEESIL